MRIAKYIVETLYWERLATLPHLRGKNNPANFYILHGLKKAFKSYIMNIINL